MSCALFIKRSTFQNHAMERVSRRNEQEAPALSISRLLHGTSLNSENKKEDTLMDEWMNSIWTPVVHRYLKAAAELMGSRERCTMTITSTDSLINIYSAHERQLQDIMTNVISWSGMNDGSSIMILYVLMVYGKNSWWSQWLRTYSSQTSCRNDVSRSQNAVMLRNWTSLIETVTRFTELTTSAFHQAVQWTWAWLQIASSCREHASQ